MAARQLSVMVATRISVMSVLLLAFAAPAFAQDDDLAAMREEEIVVTADRIRGQVDVPQAPVAVFEEGDIASYGAASLADLVEQIAPQTGSARGRGGGRPAFLVNGRRINGFREMRNYPPEAIRRIEVLPEEVALRFGFRPDQRVVNFILKDNFRSITGEIEFGFPSGGGYATNEQEISLLRIDGANRLNIAFEAEDSSMLTEAERGVASTGDAREAQFRSLMPDSRDLQLNTNWSRGLGEDGTGGTLSLSATATRSDSAAWRGLQDTILTGAIAPRLRDTRSETIEVGSAYDARVGDWNLTATANWAHQEVRTLTDTAAGDTDRALANTEAATSLVTITGQPLTLPAGEVSMVVKAGFDWDDIDSSDTRNPDIRTRLSRGDANAGFTLGVPIASHRAGAWDAIGDLSLDLSGGVSHLSDFGTLFDASAGLTWGVTRNLDLSASYIYREAAPTLVQLGAPQVVTSGATVYDFTTGQTVLVDLVSGGNPALVAERQGDWKLALNWDLPVLDRSRFVAEYYDETSRDLSTSFPVLTPAIEAAFPDRVERDGAGNLVAIDQRPVTFARQTGRRLRYGLDVSERIEGKDGGERSERRGAESGGFGPGRGRSGGRWNLALYHTWRFQQDVLVSDGGPSLDLLNGDALTDSPTARHELELEGGVFHNGIGLRLSGNYYGSSRVEGSGASGSTRLDFHSYATFDARLFVDLERQFENVDFLKGSRISLRVDNLFDAQQRVTDAAGDVPIRYEPDFIDPKGRFFEIDFRKRF